MTNIVGYSGELVQDLSRPDGTPRKLLDVSRLNALGWRARISLTDGIAQTYRWYLEHAADYFRAEAPVAAPDGKEAPPKASINARTAPPAAGSAQIRQYLRDRQCFRRQE